LLYSTFVGGSSSEGARAIAASPEGSAYVTGMTSSVDFPTTPGAYDRTCGTDGNCDADTGIPTDAYLIRLNADGSDLVFGTYLGASLNDTGYAVAVHDDGAATVAGRTISIDFPTTPGAYDTTWNENYDAFVATLNAQGTDLLYGTFLGGSGMDEAYGLARDAAGNVYLTGLTRSADYPTTPGAYDTTCGTDSACNGNYEDVFVTKLAAGGADLDYSTFLGGSASETGAAIGYNEGGEAYVGGYTVSTDFPATAGAFDETCGTGGDCWLSDAFVAKVAQDGTALIYSTFLGGESGEGVFGLGVDPQDRVTVTGGTSSAGFPTTPDGYDTTFGGGICGTPPYSGPCTDAFAAKLSPDGTELAYGTYLGSNEFDYAHGLALDPNNGNSLYLTGEAGPGFPSTPGSYDPSHNGNSDVFVTNLLTSTDASMFVRNIRLLYRERPGGWYLTVGLVRILDGASQPVPGALVSVEWTLPDGSTRARGRETNAAGVAGLGLVSIQTGAYQLCVADVTAAGYLYDPGQNWVTCDQVVIP
jgi:hypothetical protein